jgi:hypothetical protein
MPRNGGKQDAYQKKCAEQNACFGAEMEKCAAG